MGSALHNYYANGELKSSGSSITEGIGQSRITENLKKAEIDESFQSNDTDALKIVFDLLKEEGLIMGGSTGINIMGAIQLAKKLGAKNIFVYSSNQEQFLEDVKKKYGLFDAAIVFAPVDQVTDTAIKSICLRPIFD